MSIASPTSQRKSKTVIVIDKNYFCLCKRFFLEGAPDDEYANLLKIPKEKVKVFKHKMQIFEKNLRARRKKVVELEPQRRGPKIKKKPQEGEPNKRGAYNTKEMRIESHKRALKVRDLILENKSNKQIAEILKINKDFVARLRLKMFRQKMQMVKNGELEVSEEELEFKYMTPEMKARRIAKLLEEGHRAIEIGRILKIDERSVNRWRIKLKEMEKNPEMFKTEPKEPEKKSQDYFPRYRQSIEKSQVENTKKLLDCGCSYKQISTTLGITMTDVMKIKKAILKNTINEIIDDTAEKIKENVLMKKSGLIVDEEEEIKPKPRRKRKPRASERVRRKKIKVEPESDDEVFSEVDYNELKGNSESEGLSNENFEDWEEPSTFNRGRNDIDGEKLSQKIKQENYDSEDAQDFYDPLIEPEISIDELTKPPAQPTKKKTRKKLHVKKIYPRDTLGNKPLTDRDAMIAKRLLDNGIRRVDIAVMLETTEKAVSKLLDRALGLNNESEDQEIHEVVENFLRNKDKYKGVQKHYGEKGIVIKEKVKRRKKKRNVEFREVKEEIHSDNEADANEESQMEIKKQTAMRLLSVNVKIADIVKMLNVSEKMIKKWKSSGSEEETSNLSGHSTGKVSNIKEEPLDIKREPSVEEYDIM